MWVARSICTAFRVALSLESSIIHPRIFDHSPRLYLSTWDFLLLVTREALTHPRNAEKKAITIMSVSAVRAPVAARKQNERKSERTPFWFGGSASCMAACVTHPLDLGKFCQPKGTMQLLIVNSQGKEPPSDA